jgi:hypothetical protein
LVGSYKLGSTKSPFDESKVNNKMIRANGRGTAHRKDVLLEDNSFNDFMVLRSVKKDYYNFVSETKKDNLNIIWFV